MKRFLITLTLLLFGGVAARASQIGAPDRPLKLTAEVVGQRLCAGEAGVDFLHLRLRLRYANAGKQRLIVYRGSNLFFQVIVGAAGDAPPGAATYELRRTSASFVTRESEKVDTPSPNRDFVALAPGRNFEREVVVSLPVARDGAARGAGEIGPGEHMLRLNVSTWYESKQLGERLRERWRRGGELWTEPLVTTPVMFDSAGQGAARACP